MELFIWWFALSIVAGVIASSKGRSGFGFFLLSVILSPLIGVIAALVASSDTKQLDIERLDSGEARKCPDCAELIRYEAVKCRFCGASLQPVAQYKGTAGYRVGKGLASLFKVGRREGSGD